MAQVDAALSSHPEAVLRALAMLSARYEYAFGLCLVHAHCKLAEREIMLARGNVSQPEPMEHAPTFYPERWLSTGGAIRIHGEED